MKGAAAGGAAALGLTAASGSAAAAEEQCVFGLGFEEAPSDHPVVKATRMDIIDTPLTRRFEASNIPTGEDEVVIYIHGWLELFTGGAADQGHTLQLALEQNGYEHPVITYAYASSNPLWWLQTGTAEDQGRAFADWLQQYREANPNTTIRLVGHSLGARTGLGCVDQLVNEDGNAPVESITLLGGAIAQSAVTSDGEFGSTIANGANQVNNYYSENDGILDHVFQLGEFGTEAVGAYGAPDGAATPSNYADHDVSSTVAGHCLYMVPDDGCVDDVVNHFDTAPGTGGSSSSGSGGGNWLTDLFGW